MSTTTTATATAIADRMMADVSVVEEDRAWLRGLLIRAAEAGITAAGASADHSASRRVDVLEQEAPHLIAPSPDAAEADHGA